MIPDTHVKFFEYKQGLFKAIIDVVQPKDHIFISGFPLWAKVKDGLVTKVDRQHQTFHIKKLVSREVRLDARVHHGFRVDQQRVWTCIPGIVERFKLDSQLRRPDSRCQTREIITHTPVKDFLEDAMPGDYVIIWSTPDPIYGFLHYPVQGWMWSKDVEKGTVSYIHPPRMDIQTFDLNSRVCYGFGYYRKLVYQCSVDPSTVFFPTRK